MTGVMRRFSAALAAAAMAVSIVPFADISAYAEYAATHPEGFVYADGSKFMCDGALTITAARTAIISPISQRVR